MGTIQQPITVIELPESCTEEARNAALAQYDGHVEILDCLLHQRLSALIAADTESAITTLRIRFAWLTAHWLHDFQQELDQSEGFKSAQIEDIDPVHAEPVPAV